MKTKHQYSEPQRRMFNLMLALNYSEPYICMELLKEVTGLSRHKISMVLGDLISLNKILAGNEEVMGGFMHTYTPIVGRGRGTSYGYPLDYFTYEQWLEFEL